MHVAPNPGPPMGKAHDISFEREKTMMRIIHTEGAGESVREGSVVTVHFTVQQPHPVDGKLVPIFDSEEKYPEGIRFEMGRTFHAEALDLGVKDTLPGTVADVFVTCPDSATDYELGIFPSRLSGEAEKEWTRPHSPLGVAQGALEPPSMMAPKPEDTPPPWAPPQYMVIYHIRVDSTTQGRVPMYMDSYERLDYCLERKNFGAELFKRGRYGRAMRRYKKTLLDLEVPCAWDIEEHNVERNQMRLLMHLNVAACGVKFETTKPYPNLSTPKLHWDPHLDAIFHCGRVLDVDARNVKALYRRAQAHLALPAERHINGLALALDDLKLALDVAPDDAAIKKEYARARSLQKEADRKGASIYSKMVASGDS